MGTEERYVGEVLVTGPGAVGKTAMLERFCNHQFFCYEHEYTIDFSYKKQFSVDGHDVVLDFTEAPGQYEYSAMRDQDISSANVILLCFSVVDRNTFEEALYVFGRQIRRISMAAVLLVGLKLDLIGTETQHSSVSLEEGFSAAIELQAYGHFQCSSKKNIGVENLFVEVCRAGTFAGTFCSPKKPGFFSFFSKKPHRKPKRYKIHSPDVVQAPLAVIPNNIWFEIIYYLDFITLIRLSRTCKHFYHLTKTEPHWTNMSRTEWTYTGHSTTASLGRKAQSFSWDANKCFSRTTSL